MVLEVAWKYVMLYITTLVFIVIWNDAFNIDTLKEFTKNFRCLVDELAVYFEPCGFPIELVSRFCMETSQKILVLNLPVFAYGAAIGWMSPMTLLLQSENSPTGTPLTDSEVSWMGSSAYLVSIPANFFMAFLSDRLGRKNTLLLTSASAAICWIVKLSSLETWAFVVARASVGLLMAGSYVTCPLYTKDISEDSIRGVLGTLVILFHTTGNLFLYIIGDILSYRTILWVCLSIPTLHLVLFMMMPESPSFLVKTGNLDEAARALGWLRCRSEDDDIIQREIELIKKEQKHDDESSKFVFKAILSDKIIFRAFRIAITIAVARAVCGAIPVTNFAGDIFAQASEGYGLVLSPNQQAMMLGAVQVAGSTLGSSIVEMVGRKPLLFSTSLISGLSMTVLASWFLVRANDIWAPDWIPITSLCVCIFCDSSGLLPVSVVVTGEMFSFKYRGTVMATSMAVASFSCFLQMLFFKPLVSGIGVHVAFYFFGFTCLAAALYVLLVLPETKGRSLDDIYYDLKTKKEKAEDNMNIRKSNEKQIAPSSYEESMRL